VVDGYQGLRDGDVAAGVLGLVGDGVDAARAIAASFGPKLKLAVVGAEFGARLPLRSGARMNLMRC